MSDEKDFDLDSFQAEFEASWKEEEVEENEEDNETTLLDEDESEEEDPFEEIQDESDSEDMDEETEEVEDPKFQTQKQNEAFARMRREAQEAKKYQEFINKIAEQNGMKPDELLAQYEERQLEQQAEEKGVPLDILKRLNDLETENKTVKEQAFAKEFDTQVERTKEKYNLSDGDLQEVFNYMADNGLDPRNVPLRFEDAYFLANRDNILKTTQEKARQNYLADKKKRQTSSALPSGTSDSPQSDDVSDEVLAYLKEMGDI